VSGREWAVALILILGVLFITAWASRGRK